VAAKREVDFRVRPYANVFVDGKALGQTPFAPVALTDGKHRVRLVNPELKKEVTVEFEVNAGSTVFRHNLAE
jgi:serine/threonine-protein kinase